MSSALMKCAMLAANGAEEQDVAFAQRLFSYGTTYSGSVALSVISPEKALLQTWSGQGSTQDWGHCFSVDANVAVTLSSDFDALIIPGGTRSIEKLKQDPHSKRIIDGFIAMDKPIVVLGDGAALLASCDVIKGMGISAPEGLSDDITSHGASMIDEDVHIDHMLMSVRKVPEFEAQAEASKQVAHYLVENIQVSAEKIAA